MFLRFAGNGFRFVAFLAVGMTFGFRNFAEEGSFITFLRMDMSFRFFAGQLFSGPAFFGMEVVFLRFTAEDFSEAFLRMGMSRFLQKFTDKDFLFVRCTAFGMDMFLRSAEGFPLLGYCRKDERIGGAENHYCGKDRKNFKPDFFAAVLLRIFFHSLFKIAFH